ncbi:PAS domain-containing sensor histidine kinase [Chitinophaga niabensis]|uniref:histidine kinase n=1 Tax=Chitinophaga niabensis TaxID=536979 RepID=A0A1N6D4T5_9BACT|nr:PAS domain-containing sensor histidine kinase [Chitinophaga niabensis]SIN65785.1 PAS domain S-box-containing protein [Chitinophaga niabensis]
MRNDNIGFDVLFQYATLGIIVTDAEGKIILANPFLLRQFGYIEDELTGEPVEKLIPGRFGHRHKHHRDGFNQHPHSRPMGIGLDLFALRKDGSEFPVEISLGAYKTESGQFVVAFVSDISLRKASENALKELNAALEKKVEERTASLSEAVAQLNIQMQKEKELNELKSRFVSMASHEFRTPLSTVLSSAFLISKYEQSTEQPQREKHIQRIVSAVNMMTDILNDFLSVGKIEEGKIPVRMLVFDVESHISSIVQEMIMLRKKQQQIDYKHTGDKNILLDPSLLKHIVQNLLSNAIKFSPEHDTITIRTVVTDGQFVCSVKDNGIGISKEDQQHLFERFFRGNNVSDIQGTGLGLHIVSKYAELMNGGIHCHSEENKGTEFTVTFKTESAI